MDFFPFLLPHLHPELPCTDKPISRKSPLYSPSLPLLAMRWPSTCEWPWHKQGTALARASPVLGLSWAALSAQPLFLGLLEKMLHVTISQTLSKSQYTTFPSYLSEGETDTLLHSSRDNKFVNKCQWSIFTLLSVKGFLLNNIFASGCFLFCFVSWFLVFFFC